MAPMFQRSRPRPRAATTLVLLLALLPLGVAPWTGAHAQGTALSCEPAAAPAVASQLAVTAGASPVAPAVTGEPIALKIGYIPIAVYAPIFVAEAKGYYDAQGLDVSLEPFAGGSDLITFTATGELDAAIAGAGPALWNAVAEGLPLAVVAPGHAEGNPVATPLMISAASCESGAIARVADLRGKRVAVNARGATEYWLAQALSTGGLTLDDVDLQTLGFPDAVIALESGALDAAMVGEPFATSAERRGIAVRLSTDFPVQDVQPTAVLVNTDFAAANPAAVQGLVTAYLQAARDLSGAGFTDPANLTIIEEFTKIPADLVASAVAPIYAPNGEIDIVGLARLQTFFRERDQLGYDEDLDPATFVDTSYVDAALTVLGPFPDETG